MFPIQFFNFTGHRFVINCTQRDGENYKIIQNHVTPLDKTTKSCDSFRSFTMFPIQFFNFTGHRFVINCTQRDGENCKNKIMGLL